MTEHPFLLYVATLSHTEILCFPTLATMQDAFNALRHSISVLRLDMVDHTIDPKGGVNIGRWFRTGTVTAQSNIKRRD
jgi:hypothetical protein